MPTLDKLKIAGIVQNWVNGNRKDAIKEIFTQPEATAALLVHKVHTKLRKYDLDDANLFISFIEKMAEQERLDAKNIETETIVQGMLEILPDLDEDTIYRMHSTMQER